MFRRRSAPEPEVRTAAWKAVPKASTRKPAGNHIAIAHFIALRCGILAAGMALSDKSRRLLAA
jgi:hypothetical protein